MTTTPTSGAADLLAMVSKALREAYNLGMMYWQQADSEYISQHKKADDTRAKFLALVEETCAALAAGQATAAQQASTVTNYTTLGAAMRAIRQSIQMIGDPEDECMRAVKRVLRGAVIIVEDSGDEVAAPAAPAQPAVQQGVAYAALPEPDIAVGNDGRARIYTRKDIVGEPYYTAGQLRAFADATHTLRASHGEAPTQTADSQLLQFYGVTTDAELIAAQAAHIEKLQAKLTKTPSFAPQRVREG